MTPTFNVLEMVAAGVGSDSTAYLGPAAWVALIKTPFAEGPGLTFSAGDLADFTGSTPLSSAAAQRNIGVDPTTGEQLLYFGPPVGGWKWTTAGTLNLPQTIYGFALGDDSVDFGANDLYAGKLFSAPITLTGTGQVIVINEADVNFLLRLDGLY